MRTEQIYYALAVAEKGSLSKAAEEFFITQQSMRMAITTLEKELGVVLFERNSKGTKLTANGAICLDKLKTMIDIYEEIKNSAQINQQKQMDIGVNGYGSVYLSQFLEEFLLKYPQIHLKIKERQDPVALIQGVIDKELDCALTSIAANIFEQNELIKRELNKKIFFNSFFTIKVGVYLHKNHPLANLEVMPIEKMAEYPILSFNERLITEYLSKIYKFRTQPNFIISSNENILLSYVYREQGLILQSATKKEIFHYNSDLIFLLLDKAVPLYFGCFYTETKSTEHELAEIADYMKESCQKIEAE